MTTTDPEKAMDDCEEIELLSQEDEVRLDAYCARLSSLSRSRIEQLCKEGLVFLNDKPAKKNTLLRIGDSIRLLIPDSSPIDAIAQDIPLSIVYEDNDIIVIDKPAGMVVHPAPGNPDGTLVNALLHHCQGSLSGINGKIRPGIVHRLDKDTDGLILCAKNDDSHVKISNAMKAHEYTKIYHAIVYGHLPNESGTVKTAIGRSTSDRKKMANYPIGSSNAKDAVTHYRVLEEMDGYSLVELKLETGRTHQIRLHMLYLGHPVADDPLYASGRKNLMGTGQLLHASELFIRHPIHSEQCHFVSPLPERFHEALRKIR